MLHFVPESATELRGAPYAEALARLASLRSALIIVDLVAAAGGGNEAETAAAWDQASDSRKACFAARSERSVAAAAAGLEAVLELRDSGREPNPRAMERLGGDIRSAIEDLQRLLNR